MSVFTEIETLADEAWELLSESTAAKIIDNAYNAAVAELKTIGVQDLEAAVEKIGVAVLGALSGGTDAAISAGIAAAVPAFEALGKQITATTVNTLATSVVTQLQAQPTPASTPSPGAAPSAA